jgi:cyclic beta-1,2-glucan synthetase
MSFFSRTRQDTARIFKKASAWEPLRAEIFTQQQLEALAVELARSQQFDSRGGRNVLLERLHQNAQILKAAYERIHAAATRRERVAPAGEWLLDNYYLVEEHVRIGRRHLPRKYSRELARLTNGPHAGFPRVYAIALELIAHADGRIEYKNLNTFVAAYQSVADLKLGELWAIPIMLRLALIENVSRVSARIAQQQIEQESAEAWANKLIEASEKNQTEVLLAAAEMAKSAHAMTKSFVVELSRRLQMQSQGFPIALTWIDEHLSEQGSTREQLIQEESQQQAADQISIGNTISSLRTLQAIDWREFVEALSSVEHALRDDPCGAYPKTDFITRDRYRHNVEAIARRSQMSEATVASQAVDLARGAGHDAPEHLRHVGYYLIDEGRSLLERATGSQPALLTQLGRACSNIAAPLYVGSIVAITLTLTYLLGRMLTNLHPVLEFLGLVATALAASQFAVAFMNWVLTRKVPPRHMPRMDFRGGIPQDCRSVVAVPTMLTSKPGIDMLLEKMEIRYLGNRDPNLHFVLLTDFKDASEETMPNDAGLVDYAVAGIEALNREHGPDRFLLFHRPRKWNATERVWMGYERKRGKLSDLNRFLINGSTDAFSRIAGESGSLKNVKYVITLDTDTQLPKDSARQMIAAMAHPLNRPIIDASGRVQRGYTILQPTSAIHLVSAQASRFSVLFSGEPGIDPYTQAISEVYQDLFGEGSFVGKGIYDLKMFECVLDKRFPENRILSHDLLEGCHVRATLLTDVILFEEFPSRYLADMMRRHRWIRGDWQIMRWLLPWVPTLDGSTSRNALSLLSRWKIFDNLRRSVVPAAIFAVFVIGWLAALKPVACSVFALLTIFFPLLTTICTEIFSPIATSDNFGGRSFFRKLVREIGQSAARQLLILSFLPYEAYVGLDAAARTLFRLWFSRRKLLEWATASETDNGGSGSPMDTLRAMWIAPVASALTFAAILAWRPETLVLALPVLLIWFLSPLTAWYVSRPITDRAEKLGAEDVLFLRKVARRTWSYFEKYAAEEDNWLPPDNFQEFPVAVVAHRTSPTNIGMGMLATLSAYDMGFVTSAALLTRARNMITTLHRMERYHGHFYNWYDTRSLRPLLPQYISTVDSGNLAGHLLVFRQGLLELPSAPIVTPTLLSGLSDTLEMLEQDRRAAVSVRGKSAIDETPLAGIRALLDAPPPQSLLEVLDLLAKARKELSSSGDSSQSTEPMLAAIESVERFIRDSAPWLSLPDIADLAISPEHSGWLAELCSSRLSLEQISRAASHTGLPDALRDALKQGADRARETLTEIDLLASDCQSLASMDFKFLFDAQRELFTIGFNVSDHRADSSYYDLFASEARLASYLAIAQGQVKQEHWFSLGRNITAASGEPTLVSWSGSMFEYLMPLLVMPDYKDTLLHETYNGVVARQIEYGRERGVPWGISESGYNLTDANLNYQYQAFGVPGLGLKRGLSEDLVIAPYATVLALMVRPRESISNLRWLDSQGRTGAHGFYEAIDYTPARLPRGVENAVIRSYMAHHQGMSLLAIDYVLHNQPMQRRFTADPHFKSAEMLLHERVPRAAGSIQPHEPEVTASRNVEAESSLRVVTDPSTPVPEVHLLSNGRYHVMVNAAGSGCSRLNQLAVTRWRSDAVRDQYGVFCYIRDLGRNVIWSTAFQPTLETGENYQAIFSQGRAEFRRSDEGIDTHTEISVAAEDNVEVRRMTLTNTTPRTREIEITTYGEVVISPQAADLAHPAFNNLFVQTEIDRQHAAILCTRRARGPGETPPWLVHMLVFNGIETGPVTFETDRSRFVGRLGSLESPNALSTETLNDSQGSVLDPVVSIRRRIRIEPHGTARLDLILGIADTRAGAEGLAAKYTDHHMSDRVYEMAWTQAQVMLQQLNVTESQAQLFERLAGSIIYPSQYRRASPHVVAKNRRGQSGLWGYGISGDLPIVYLRIADPEHLDLVRQTVLAHAYWRMRGLAVDLVISNEDASTYRKALYDQIVSLVSSSTEGGMIDKPGGVFVRRADQITEEDRTLLQTAASVVLNDSEGTFQDQVERRMRPEFQTPRLKPSIVRREFIARERGTTLRMPVGDLKSFNGFGGFSRDGREYVIVLPKGTKTPAPWVNVIANPFFGTVISESGSAYTWLENSHEFRLTPWSNDPVTDTSGEAFYIRDEESGEYWSPAPLPARGDGTYRVRHGFGYTVHEIAQSGIASEMTTCVAIDAPVKLVTLKLRNDSAQFRRISLTGYFEWILGELRQRTQMHVVTELDPKTGALLARNRYSPDFPDRIAFLDCTETNRTFTGDRAEFIGRNGSLAEPMAMGRSRLTGRIGAALDACGAVQAQVTLAPRQEREVVFVLGVGRDPEDVQKLLARFRSVDGAHMALDVVRDYWAQTLGAVQVETPDPAMNLLTNGWLLYQTLSCRMWARTGFYQSGGAFGFRDQLQDSMALLHSEPALFRKQILRAAAHQFRQGDVQHWWHPPSGRGVRTHFSDDYLWLPYAVSRYVTGTGDTGLLDEPVNFIEGRAVNEGEEAYYDLPLTHDEIGSIYEHCVRAIRNGMKFGRHGLPLMGCGDWNDGMNLVGAHGRGESVWLAFFLYDVLHQFAVVAEKRGDLVFSRECRDYAAKLHAHIEAEAWDGQWYRRAYFDDGTPLGSAANSECRIDALPQSWAVLSSIQSDERVQVAMKAVDQLLVKRKERLIQLFEPPFDKSEKNPGYIKGYVPGVRENGGQYTHAAIWTVMAFAKLGDAERAWELFNLINPLNHARTFSEALVYKVEPYVVAADVYAVSPHTGRGGWTWYTGSAGWMYRLLLESLLGVQREGSRLRIQPCVPAEWTEYRVRYTFGKSVYKITVKLPGQGTGLVSVDGKESHNDWIQLTDDGREHDVVVTPSAARRTAELTVDAKIP